MSVQRARQLRKSMTEAEKALWSHLRNRQFHDLRFRRQHPVGPYVVDFYCAARQLVIELDGGQHTAQADAERTAFLENRDLRVIRFWNNDVLQNIEGALHQLEQDLDLI